MKEVICPICYKRVWLTKHGKVNKQFSKVLDLSDYNLIHDVVQFRECDSNGEYETSSLHIYTLGRLEINGQSACLKKVLMQRFRGF